MTPQIKVSSASLICTRERHLEYKIYCTRTHFDVENISLQPRYDYWMYCTVTRYANTGDGCVCFGKGLLGDVMLHTQTRRHSVGFSSLRPPAPAALSSGVRPLWVSVPGTRRVSSPIRSGPKKCPPSPGRSASARWCWSGAWASLLEARRPRVTGQPWHKEMRPGEAWRGTTAMLYVRNDSLQ